MRCKSILSLLLAVLLVFSACMPAFAAETELSADAEEITQQGEIEEEPVAVLSVPEPEETPEPEAAQEPETTPEPQESEAEDAPTAISVEPEPIASASSEPAAISEPANLYVYFRETGALITVGDGKNILWFSIGSSIGKTTEFDIYLQKPGEESAQKATFTSSSSGSTAGIQLEEPKVGEYKVTLKKPGDETVVATGAVKLIQVTFDPDGGSFPEGSEGVNQDGKYVGFGTEGAQFSHFKVPTPTNSSDADECIGWSKQQSQTNYENLESKIVSDGSDTLTLYAAYGTPRKWVLGVYNENGAEPVKEIDLGAVDFGDTETTKTLTLKNTGNIDVKDLAFLDAGTPFDARFEGGAKSKEKLGPESAVKFTVCLKTGTGVGRHTSPIYVSVGRRIYELTIPTRVTVRTKEFTVTPPAAEKTYGETFTAAQIDSSKVTVEPNTTAFQNLGVTLGSVGFSARADAGSYDYYISSIANAAGCEIQLNKKNQFTVTPETPAYDVNATAVHVGGKLSASVLTGSFYHPDHPDWIVRGDLKWEDPEQSVGDTVGSQTFNWVFTPTGTDANNYKEVHGTASVQITEKILTELTPVGGDAESFVYDGNAHVR